MWYFSWILGLGLALCFGVLNAIWYEVLESQREAASHPPSAHRPSSDQPPS
jgi:cyd operon protein YbgT